ncbi:MAG: pilus assembly protein [Gammaproteobacteria bacterium]|nr:pilus assembly protein [Gammaproteobacteria bacterium]
MVETLVILFVTLLLLLGVIQFGLIYNAKTNLSYAAFEGARAGALNYADREAIEYGLARGLAGLYASVEKADGRMDAVDKVQRARDKVFAEFKEGKFACIERLNPTNQAFSAYGRSVPTGVKAFSGKKLIPNDHLVYRSGLVNGGAGVSIQDANLLKIRVTYCYPLYVPFIANTIKRLYGLMADERPLGTPLSPAGSFQRHCLMNDRIPIVAQSLIRMQTPAYNDPSFDKDCN